LLSISLYQGYFDFKTVNTRREKIRKFKLKRVNEGERERERKVKKRGAHISNSRAEKKRRKMG